MADITFNDNPAPSGPLLPTDGFPGTEDPGGTPVDRFITFQNLIDAGFFAQATGNALSDPVWTPPFVGSLDDEFANGSTIDPLWIDVGLDPLPAWRQGGGILSAIVPAQDSAGQLHAKVRSIGGLVTPPCRFELAVRSIVHTQNFPMVGLVLADGATVGAGSQFILGYYSQNALPRRWVGTHTDYTAFTAIANEQWGSIGGVAQFLALEFGAEDSVTVQVSSDGIQWDTISMHTLAFAPTHAGLFVSGWSDGAASQFGIDHFRGRQLTNQRTIAFGDSISGLYGVETSSGWLRQVANRGSDITIMRNAGVSGNSTTQMLARVVDDVVFHTPNIVTVTGGINDIFDSGTAPATIQANLAAIYDELEAAEIDFIACTIPPRSSYGLGSAADWIAVNAWIVANYTDWSFARLCDWQPTLTTGSNWSANLSDDGVHPNGRGSSVMATFIAPIIDAI